MLESEAKSLAYRLRPMLLGQSILALTVLHHVMLYLQYSSTSQAESKYQHSLTFHVRHYVVMATKPVH